MSATWHGRRHRLIAATQLAEFVDQHPGLLLLTGAGVSTGSGIPGYRDASGAWQHPPPIQYQDFVNKAATRQRYWARSLLGWPRMRAAKPNAAHHAIAALQQLDARSALITQNVDQLHQRAGSTDVVELHGSLGTVSCLSCNQQIDRADYQNTLMSLNPDVQATAKVLAKAPDGDAAIEGVDVQRFVVPACDNCAGIMKPDVVFFGEAVPRSRVERSYAATDEAPALLVIGSSLVVFSGYRFARHAHAAGKPVCLLNKGLNRADGLASLKVDADCATVLTAACRELELQLPEADVQPPPSAL